MLTGGMSLPGSRKWTGEGLEIGENLARSRIREASTAERRKEADCVATFGQAQSESQTTARLGELGGVGLVEEV